MELFLKILHNLTTETYVFIGLTIVAAIFCYKKKEIQKAPAILTTIAILGTFFGIAMGLLDFDANNVQKSIPSLINGIKTAFWASIWGISLAIGFKIYPIIAHKNHIDTPKDAVTAEDLHGVLLQIKKSLSDDTDSSLISQFKLLRSDFSDFLRNASENNSKALIDALKDVMRDFNAKINEQFGDNFKQLNQAVEKILIWQEEYRNQVTEMITQNNESAKNLSQASKDFALIADNTKSFTQSAENCGNLINSLNQQSMLIENSIEKLSSYVEIAKNGLPDIQDNLIKTIKQMENITIETSSEFKNQLVSMIKENDSFLKNQFNEMNIQNKALQQELHKTLLDTLTTSTDEIKSQSKIINEMSVQNKALNQEFHKTLLNTLTESTNTMNIQNKSLQQELHKTLLNTLTTSTDEIKSQSKIIQTDLTQNTKELTTSIKHNVDELKQQFMSSVQENNSIFQNQIQEIHNNHKTLQDELRKILLESLQSSNSEINTQVKGLIEQTRQQIVSLDKALNDELTKSLESFGKQMASLSSRFTNDYTPLTDKLRDIVQIANKIKS